MEKKTIIPRSRKPIIYRAWSGAYSGAMLQLTYRGGGWYQWDCMGGRSTARGLIGAVCDASDAMFARPAATLYWLPEEKFPPTYPPKRSQIMRRNGRQRRERGKR